MAIRFTIFARDDTSNASVLDFDMEKIVVGRGAVCDMRLPHPSVSYQHATVEVDGSRYFVRDLSSTNGTLVNGERIPPDFRQVVHSDDVIEIAGFKIVPTLSVPMQGSHSDERTETVARDLLRGSAGALGPTRLLVGAGPHEGLQIELPDEPGSTVRIGRASTCELRLENDDVDDVHLMLESGLAGWRIQGGATLRDGQTLEVGPSTVVFEDPLGAYYETLLRSREDLDPSLAPDPPPASQEPVVPPPAEPDPVVQAEPEPLIDDAPVTSRAEVVDVARDATRLPEYSWMVVLLGILAFLASLGLILMLVF